MKLPHTWEAAGNTSKRAKTPMQLHPSMNLQGKHIKTETLKIQGTKHI
jgi:hypothetical protein